MITAIAQILRIPDLLPCLVGEWALIPKCCRVYQSCNGRHAIPYVQWEAPGEHLNEIFTTPNNVHV